jgi:integrase
VGKTRNQRVNLSKRRVEALKPLPGGRRKILDTNTHGLGVMVHPSGRRVFYWYRKVNGQPTHSTLGDFPEMSVEQARRRCSELNGFLSKWKENRYEGENPFEKKERIVPANAPTFREMVEAYVQGKVRPEANRPDRAEYSVRWMTKKYFAAWLDRKIDKIIVEDMLTVKNACGKHGYMANRCVEFVRALFNWSARSKDGRLNFWPVENPAKDVESFKEKKRKRFLQPDEMSRFNDALEDETHADLKDFLTLALATGARRENVFSMRWQDVQWERRIWSVPYSKNGEPYDVQLLPNALGVLERRRARITKGVYVFPGVGKTGHLIDLKKPWNEFRKRAGLTDFRLHDLRHTHASYLAIAGVPLQQIGAALGHRSLQSTEVYAHLHDEAVRAGRESGQAKMLKMMRGAKKRAKIAARKQKLLAGGGA